MLVSLILTRKDSIPPTKVLIKSEIGNTRVTEYLPYKESIEKELTEKYLAEYPEYTNTFKVFWVKPDNGARFVED